MIEPKPWTPQIVTLALAQFAMQAEPAANLKTALSYIAEAATKKADIICLPELFRTPYFYLRHHDQFLFAFIL